MARPRAHIPALVHHKPTGQARVRINGRDIYLGKYGTAEAEAAYRRVIAQHLSGDDPRCEDNEPSRFDELSINELLVRYLRFAERYYRKNGEPTSRQYVIRSVLKLLKEHFGETPAGEFRPRKLKVLQQEMILRGWCRRTINDYTDAAIGVFRWAVGEDLISPSILEALRAVPGLRKGRTEAREPGPVEPVPEEKINAVLPHVSRQVRDMIRLQLLSGCRPGEICALRPCDVERDGDVWLYRPESHKTEHHGRERIIFVGPRAQEILKPWLNRPEDSYCFSPAEAEAERNAERRRGRKTPLTPSQAARRPKKNRRRAPAQSYTAASYRRAVHRGCEVAFGMPDELRCIPKRLPAPTRELLREKAREWRREHCWNPNQLRHSRATVIRKTYGIEPAQLVLGHADADVTQIYAERDLERAREIMLEIG